VHKNNEENYFPISKSRILMTINHNHTVNKSHSPLLFLLRTLVTSATVKHIIYSNKTARCNAFRDRKRIFHPMISTHCHRLLRASTQECQVAPGLRSAATTYNKTVSNYAAHYSPSALPSARGYISCPYVVCNYSPRCG